MRCGTLDTKGMTSVTTQEQAIRVLQILTAEHGQAPYFLDAEVVYSDGFFGVDLKVDGEKWRTRPMRDPVPPQIDRVPVYVVVNG